MKLPEKLLHFIWRYKLINHTAIYTTHGETVRILDFGQYNTDAGPDFEFAKVQIANRTWVGNVELHTYAKDWEIHRHHTDPRYNSTILHVVWENDSTKPTLRLDGSMIATVVLKDYVDHAMLEKYQYLMDNERWIACENLIGKISPLTVNNWLGRLVVERLEFKKIHIDNWALTTNYDWEKIQLIALGKAFGMNVNAHAFENLIQNLQINLLHKYRGNHFQLEALLFGCAGFLTDVTIKDQYFIALKNEFAYLKQLHNLSELSQMEWKFMRMRPYNFPTYRLAQLCGLLNTRTQWFELMVSSSLEDVKKSLSDIKCSEYWNNHFHFQKETSFHKTVLTETFIQHVILNACIPVLFAYGKSCSNTELLQKAINWLEQLHAENNTIIKSFQNLNIKACNASESQALLHLYKNYCTSKKCLDCAIGYAILSS